MSRAEPALPRILEGTKRLAAGQTFAFTCHPGVPCFNACCADVNIILTPLDVLRLARSRGLHTREFLDTHTLHPITKDLQLPIRKMLADGHLKAKGQKRSTTYFIGKAKK